MLKNLPHGNAKAFLSALFPALLAAWLFASHAAAAALPPAARGEIDSLLSRLAASGCQFKRNGSWHTADAAQVHLARKLEYLVGKGAVASAEQFIERAATRSSVSGTRYLVKCGGTPAVPSAQWLHAQLQALRAESAAPAVPPR